MAARKFQGHKLMMVARLPRRRERLIFDGVKTGAPRNIIFLATIADRTAAFQVETEFNAARVEAQAPVERPARPEIVPLNAHAHAVEIAVKLAPALGDFTPGAALSGRFVGCNHRAKLTSGANGNASQV